MISSRIIAQPPVLTPRSIPTLPSSQCAFIPAKKKSVLLSNMLLFHYLTFLKFRKSKIVYFEIT